MIVPIGELDGLGLARFSFQRLLTLDGADLPDTLVMIVGAQIA